MSEVIFTDPYIHVEGNIAWANSGDVMKCYTVDLPEIYSSSESDFDMIYDAWYKAARALGSKMILFKQDVCLKERFDSSTMPDGNFFQRATRKLFNGRPYIGHRCYLYFIYTDVQILKNKRIQNPFAFLPSVKQLKKDLAALDDRFDREVNNVIEHINTSRKIKVIPMTTEEIRGEARKYFNGYYKNRTTDTQKEEDYYRIGDRYTGAYVVNKLSNIELDQLRNVVKDAVKSIGDNTFYNGYADCLSLELPFDHVYNQVFFLEDHFTLKESVKANQSHLYGARGFGAENKIGAELLQKYLEEEVAQDEKIKFIRVHFSVIFFADSKKEFEQADSAIDSAFKKLNIVPHYPKGNHLANIFNNTHPGHISYLNVDNTFIYDLQSAVCFLPSVTNYKNDTEGIYFNDRLTNIPVRKDVWDAAKKRIKARNFLIDAPTGEGKSYLIQNILRQFIEQKTIVVLNDLGDSYLKFSKLFPEISLYIKYKHGQPLGINPMYLPAGEQIEITQINSVLAFVSLLWKREQKLTTEQKVSLRKIIIAYYENVEVNHSFPSFYQFIERNKATLLETLEIDPFFFSIDEFLHNCSEFIGDGAYGFLFRENKHISYDLTGKRLVVFEFDEAKEDPLLLSTLLLMSSEVTRKLCWLDRSERGVVLFEEFARFLKFENVLNSVEYYYQAGRKQGCATGIVLQTTAQLPENDTAKSILENTQVIYMLTNIKGYEPEVKRLRLGSHAHNQLISMSSNLSGKRKYTEFFLQIGNEGNVMRLEVPVEIHCAYLTEGDEHMAIMKLYEETGDMEKAIQKYIEQRQLQPA